MSRLQEQPTKNRPVGEGPVDRDRAEIDAPVSEIPMIDAHVVILNNYLRRHHVVAYQEIAKRVRKLTILLSVEMEADRQWDAQWDGLDVVVQKNKTITRKWRHSSGFSEDNFIHIPVDTGQQLKKLKPDVILSYEMGMRTILCGLYRMFNRDCRLVMVGNMSQHIEQERGLLRRSLRKAVVRLADYFTYNGPSCKRYLKSLGIVENRLFHFPYCIDPESVCTLSREEPAQSPRKLLYCGALSSRKGILQFVEIARDWCKSHPDHRIELELAGSGELRDKIADCSSDNFQINFLGNCDLSQLREAYHRADVCVFPTLADEWGLVPIEAMASGVPVLGSIHAQSVETYVTDEETGWTFDTDSKQSIETALEKCMLSTVERLKVMGAGAKQAIAHISPVFSANEACQLISMIAAGDVKK